MHNLQLYILIENGVVKVRSIPHALNELKKIFWEESLYFINVHP